MVILGAMPSEWEERDFGQSALNLTRAAEKRGDEIIIAAPFKMHFINGKNPRLNFYNLEELDQVEGLMKKVKSKTAPGDTVNLLLYGRGAPTTNEKDYNETKILLGSEKVEIEDLVEEINDHLPKDRGIKTIAPFCFLEQFIYYLILEKTLVLLPLVILEPHLKVSLIASLEVVFLLVATVCR